MKEMIDIISEHPFLAGLDQALMATIAGCAKNAVYNKDEYLFREGEPAHSLYLVRHGKVSLEMFAPGKKPISFLTVKEGESLGLSALIEPYQSLYDAQALEPTRVVVFDHHCLLEKCEADHEVGYTVMKRMLPLLSKRLQAARLQSANLYGPA